MRKKPITLKEVALLADCSISTVSRALNDSGYIDAETHKAVLDASRKLGYVPSSSSRKPKRMVKAKKGLIEVVFHNKYIVHESLVNPDDAVHKKKITVTHAYPKGEKSFYHEILEGLTQEAHKWGYRTILKNTSDLLSPSFLADLNASDKSGVILLGEYSDDLALFSQSCTHPLILADLICDSRVNTVTTDNIAGIALAFQHIYELGHRQIGYIAGPVEKTVGHAERWLAFKVKMLEADLPLRQEWCCSGPNQVDVTAKDVLKILSKENRPTAFVCCNDIAAIGVFRAAHSAGLSIPQDLSVIGFDDIEAASLVTPSLTTIRVPVLEIGRQAVRQLMLDIRTKAGFDHKGYRIRLMPELIIRNSTAKV